jgi:hypothetical protein
MIHGFPLSISLIHFAVRKRERGERKREREKEREREMEAGRETERAQWWEFVRVW